MRFIWQHIEAIIQGFHGMQPLALFLKDYFRRNPRLGSRDRRILSDMVYSWYRCSKGFDAELAFETKMQACIFLCAPADSATRKLLPESWGADKWSQFERISFLERQQGIRFQLSDLLSFKPELSDGILTDEWLLSMLRQPRLFIRVVEALDEVIGRLEAHLVTFEKYEHMYGNVRSVCLALPNSTAVDKILAPHTYVVQDLSSQQTGYYFRAEAGEYWWDCCAGAGGKSLLLRHIAPGLQLTVSDRRKTVLNNLKARFRQYGLAVPEICMADVSNADVLHGIMGRRQFDQIICDVPCSGSGTWARTPEEMFFTNEVRAQSVSDLQRQIAVNALSYLRPGGNLIYITCSVFRRENEMVSAQLASLGLSLVEQKLINGVAQQADSMYVAVLR